MGEMASNTEEKGKIVKELKKVSFMAGPMVVVSLSQYLMLAVSQIMAGHLGTLPLSGVSIATSFANASGFSILTGLSAALETLCGQAYGAEQYRKFGSYTYCSILCLVPICLPISILWIFMDKLLISIGLDPEISRVAQKYSIGLIPALFSSAIIQTLFRYFQTQSLILPLLITSCVALAIHIPLSWALIFKCGLGEIGGAISISLCSWLNVILLAFYMKYSYACKKTTIVCWKEIFSSVPEFWRFAIPSAVMVCLKWWVAELVILLAGLLPNSELQTSALSICVTVSALHYNAQFGFSVAASTRVSNELGSGNPHAARYVVRVVLAASATEAVIVSTALFCSRRIFGYAFTNDKEVVSYVTEIAPFLCLSLITDSLQAVISGIARGCGWQRKGAFINLSAYYFVGIPLSVVLCFVVHLRGKGLWIGVLTGSTLQVASLGTITALTNWQNQASMARERIFKQQLQRTVDGDTEL